jgi:hypothetical protein
MAVEIGLQARLARQKLKTNLVLLNNASVRTAEKVREKSTSTGRYNHSQEFVYDGRDWIATYVLVAILSLFSLLYTLHEYEVFTKLFYIWE